MADIIEKKEPKIPWEHHLAKGYLDLHYLTRDETDAYRFNGQFWQRLTRCDIDRVRVDINTICKNQLDYRKMRDIWPFLFMNMTPVPPFVNLNQPNPYMANFQNGTLKFKRNLETGKYDITFGSHKPEDYATSVLPFNYSEVFSPAPLFTEMLERMFPSDKATKDFIYEFMGACLISAFPKICFFIGDPGTGKSTLIHVILNMLSPNNICSVPPHEMKDFGMEPMIGKLLNYDFDIALNRPMVDDQLKKIIDNKPWRVNRKNKSIVDARIPAMHLFAANRLPKSLDGASHAYERRVAMIKFNHVISPSFSTLDFWELIWAKESAGIVYEAIRGLRRLIENNGKYTVPSGSKDMVREMEMDSDYVGQFLDDIKAGEIHSEINVAFILRIDKNENANSSMSRKSLWNTFANWQKKSLDKIYIKKHSFFERLAKDFDVQCQNSYGVRVVKGITDKPIITVETKNGDQTK